MNDNKPQPHHLWEVHAVSHDEPECETFLSWSSFYDFWTDPNRWKISTGSDEPPFEDYFEYDPLYIQLMMLVRWHWIDDTCNILCDGSDPDEWLWDDREPSTEELAVEAMANGCLYMTFYHGRLDEITKIMVRVNRTDEGLIRTWLKEQLDFIVGNIWYPLQVDGKKVTRVSDDWQEREVAVQLWADP